MESVTCLGRALARGRVAPVDAKVSLQSQQPRKSCSVLGVWWDITEVSAKTFAFD